MPHYSDGTEAKVGDLAFGKSHGGTDPVAGYVLDVTPGTDTCNIHIPALRPFAGSQFGGALLNTAHTGNPARRNFHPPGEPPTCRAFTLLHRQEAPAASLA